MLTVYSKQHCMYCEMLTNLLDENQVAYNLVDVGQSEESLRWLKAQGHKTVPQVYSKGQHVGDYSYVRDNLESIL